MRNRQPGPAQRPLENLENVQMRGVPRLVPFFPAETDDRIWHLQGLRLEIDFPLASPVLDLSLCWNGGERCRSRRSHLDNFLDYGGPVSPVIRIWKFGGEQPFSVDALFLKNVCQPLVVRPMFRNLFRPNMGSIAGNNIRNLLPRPLPEAVQQNLPRLLVAQL